MTRYCMWVVRSILFILLAGCSLPLSAQPFGDLLWIKQFGMEARNLQISLDGRWVVLGQTLYRASPDLWHLEPAAVLDGRACFAGNHLLAVAEPRGVVLRHLPSLRPVVALPDTGSVSASDDGKWLLTVVRSTQRFLAPRELHVWQTAPLRLRFSLPLENNLPEPVLSADGGMLAYPVPAGIGWYTSIDVVVMRLSDVREVARFHPAGYVHSLALSPRGDRIAISTATRLNVYETASQRLLYAFDNDGTPFNVVRFSPNGQYLAAAASGYEWLGGWKLWSLTDGSPVASEETSPLDVYTLGFSPDSGSLWVAFQRTVKRVDTLSGSLVDTWFLPRLGTPLGFTPDSQQVVGLDGQEVLFTRLEDGTLQRRVRLPENSAFYTSALSPDARFIGLVSYDVYPYELRVYELTEPMATLAWSIPLAGDLLQLAFSPDGVRLFGVEDTGKLRAWFCADGSEDPSVPDIYSYPIALSGDGRLLAGRTGTSWVVRQLPDYTVLYTLPESGSVQFSADGRFLVATRVSFSELRVMVYDALTGNLLGGRSFTQPGDFVPPFSVSPSPNGEQLLVRWGNRLLFFRMPSPVVVLGWRYVPTGWHPGYSVSFSPNGKYLLLGDFALLRSPTGDDSVGGYVQIPGWVGVAPEHLRYTLRRYETGEVVDEGTLSLDPRGLTSSLLFSIPAPSGRYWLTVSGKPFLTRTVEASGSTLRVTLLAGDIDGDNEVTLFDFGRLVAAFGSIAGEERYDIDADLDGDGEITLWDFAWLVRSFGLVGDE